MKTILVSNSSLAAVLKEALAEYTCRPSCAMQHKYYYFLIYAKIPHPQVRDKFLSV